MTDYKVTITVPTAVDQSVHVDVRERFIGEFGGYTQRDVSGAWESGGNVIYDESIAYEANTRMSEHLTRKWAKRTAAYVQNYSDEEAVMWEIQEVEYGFE